VATTDDSDARAPVWQRASVAACAGVVGFCLTYGAVDYGHVAHLFYVQRERTFRMAERMTGAPSGYVGLWLWALAGGAAAAAIGWAATRRRVGERALGLWLAWAATAFLLVGAYFTWNNMP
jgi:hypothetical protein